MVKLDRSAEGVLVVRSMSLLLLVVLALAISACVSSDMDGENGDDQKVDVIEDPTAPGTDQTASGGFVVDGGLTIADALTYDGTEPIAVQGYVVITGQVAYLCEALAESFPPQCGGQHLSITNPAATSGLVLVEEADTQWSEHTVTVFGTITGDEFTLDNTITG